MMLDCVGSIIRGEGWEISPVHAPLGREGYANLFQLSLSKGGSFANSMNRS